MYCIAGSILVTPHNSNPLLSFLFFFNHPDTGNQNYESLNSRSSIIGSCSSRVVTLDACPVHSTIRRANGSHTLDMPSGQRMVQSICDITKPYPSTHPIYIGYIHAIPHNY